MDPFWLGLPSICIPIPGTQRVSSATGSCLGSSLLATPSAQAHRRAANPGYPPSAQAWQAPRRRWIALHRLPSMHQPQLENQALTRP